MHRPVLGAELVLKRAVHGDRHVCRLRSLDVGRARRGTGRSWVPPALAARVASLGALFAALDVVEVADVTSQPVKDVAALHFRLGSRLHLHWLRGRIADLKREDRWQEMARAALRDDLFSLHGELTADVLHGSPAAGDVDARLDAFTESNAAALNRCQNVLADIRASGTHDLTTLPVALRELRNLIQSTAPVSDEPAVT